MKYVLMIILILVMFVTAINFGAQNNQVVTFNYLISRNQFQMSTLITSLFAIGFIIGCITCGLFWLRAYLTMTKIKRKIKKLERQIALLKATHSNVDFAEISNISSKKCK